MQPSSGYTRLNAVKKFVKIRSRAWWHTRVRAIWNSAQRRASKQKKIRKRGRGVICQILTNQNIKLGRRAWSTRDSEKSQKRLPSLHVKAGWIFLYEISSKSNFKSAAHEHDLFHMHLKKMNLIRSGQVRRYWSAETLFWQLWINQNIDVQY